MIIRLLLTASLSVMVLAMACGGGEASTPNAPTSTASVEKSTVTPPPTSERTPTVQSTPYPSATAVNEADRGEALASFEAGVALQEKGHLEEAIAKYDEAIRLDPSLPWPTATGASPMPTWASLSAASKTSTKPSASTTS